MDVRVENVNSTIRVADSDALLSPEVMRLIITAVKQQLEQDKALEAERKSDTTIERGASRIR